MTRFAWLIEHGPDDFCEGTIYLQTDPDRLWVKDANEARHFSTQEEAEYFRSDNNLWSARVVEHGFMES